jgi:hypothetical protein
MSHIPRRAALCLLGILWLLVAMPGVASAQPATNYAPPSNLKVVQTTGDIMHATWSVPATYSAQVTTYVLRLDNTVIGRKVISLGVIKPELDIQNSTVAAGGMLTVSAVIGTNLETDRSAGVRIAPQTPITQTPGQPAAKPDTNPTDGGGEIFGGAAVPPKPDTPVKNNNTAFEVYGLTTSYLTIYTHLKTLDPTEMVSNGGDLLINGYARGLWQMAVFIEVSGIVFFSWALSRKTYAALSTVALSLVGGFSKSVVSKILLDAGAIAYLIWGIRRLKNDHSSIYKASLFAVLFLASSTLYLANTGTVVPMVTQAPLRAAQLAIVQTDKWAVSGDTEADYNLSIRPTYEGADQLEQGMRRHADAQWLSNGYRAWLQVNFGNAKWAMTTFVPDNKDLPTYRGLTFGEFLFKATKENNKDAMNYLTGDGIFNGKGEIEKASPEVWNFVQGHDPWLRILYSAVALGSQLLIAPLTWGLGLLIAIVIVLTSIDAVLLAIWLMAGIYPDFRQKIFGQLKGMARRTLTPAFLCFAVLLSMKILDALLSLLGPSGWLVGACVRSLGTVVMVIAGIFLVRNWLRTRGERIMGDISAGELQELFAGRPSAETPVAATKATAIAPAQPAAKPSLVQAVAPMIISGVATGGVATALQAVSIASTVSSAARATKPSRIAA